MAQQIAANRQQSEFNELVVKQLELLIKVVEDHEADMIKMAKKIEELESRINNMK